MAVRPMAEVYGDAAVPLSAVPAWTLQAPDPLLMVLEHDAQAFEDCGGPGLVSAQAPADLPQGGDTGTPKAQDRQQDFRAHPRRSSVKAFYRGAEALHRAVVSRRPCWARGSGPPARKQIRTP